MGFERHECVASALLYSDHDRSLLIAPLASDKDKRENESQKRRREIMMAFSAYSMQDVKVQALTVERSKHEVKMRIAEHGSSQ